MAKDALAQAGLRFDEIDIDSQPELRERYDESVPVVFIDGRERFRGRVDPFLLRRHLSARPG